MIDENRLVFKGIVFRAVVYLASEIRSRNCMCASVFMCVNWVNTMKQKYVKSSN